jgi:hypothetical protein
MHCPICNEEMTLWKEELASNKKSDSNVTYLRRRYRCKKDDVWGRLEVPTGVITGADQRHVPVVAAQ